MCQMRSPVPPTSFGESTPPPFNSALALYPTLNSDSRQTSPSQSDPNLHLAGLLVPGAAEAFGRTWTTKVPKEFMGPELPPILPAPGPKFAPFLPRPIGPAPALPAPIGGPLFKPVHPDTNQASPPPFPAPSPRAQRFPHPPSRLRHPNRNKSFPTASRNPVARSLAMASQYRETRMRRYRASQSRPRTIRSIPLSLRCRSLRGVCGQAAGVNSSQKTSKT